MLNCAPWTAVPTAPGSTAAMSPPSGRKISGFTTHIHRGKAVAPRSTQTAIHTEPSTQQASSTP